MRAVYVMCDGTLRKIGISSRPKLRRSQVQMEIGRKVALKHQFWITDAALAARVEIMAHALAGTPVLKREWFNVSASEACEFIAEAISRLGAITVSGRREATSDSQKRAIANHRSKKIEAGFRACTFTLSEGARSELKMRAKTFGSQAAALEAAIDEAYDKMVAPSV